MTQSISPQPWLARLAVQPLVTSLPIHDHWQETAARKGFRITRRVNDRYQFMLLCDRCGLEHRSKRTVLMDSQPLCPHCVEARWRDDAAAAGLLWIGRDPQDHRHGYYLAQCGHVQRCQFVNVKKVAREQGSVRCDECQRDIEEAEALTQGWTRIGPAPDRGPDYRVYRHSCGHKQSIARINMQSGRFNCASCGEGWSTAPSNIYCMRFELPGMLPLVKLGFSRNPDSRLNYQLKRSPDLFGEILHSVPIRNGHIALCLEKRMHAALRRDHRDSVIPPEQYSSWLRVKSEIYSASIEPKILQMLEDLAADSSVRG